NVMWPRLESLVPPGHCLRGTPDGTATGMPRLRQTVCCVQHILIQQVATRKILSLARKAAKKTPTDKICQPHTVADCQEELVGLEGRGAPRAGLGWHLAAIARSDDRSY